MGGFELQSVTASNSAILYNGAGTYNITNGTLISSNTGATELDLYTASGSTINIACTVRIPRSNQAGGKLFARIVASKP